MRYVHRTFLFVLIGCAAVWAWSAIMGAHYRARDRSEQRIIAEREAAAARQFSEELRKAQEDFRQGKATPLPELKSPSLDDLKYSLIRGREVYHYAIISGNAQLGLFGTLFLWIMTNSAVAAWRRKQWEAPTRKPEPTAGKLVADLVLPGKDLFAKTKQEAGPVVQIEGRRGVVIFRNLSFICSFAGNPRQSLVELPFSEILSIYQEFHKGHSYFTVRTTAGKVILRDDLHPFQTMGEVLADIVELNRAAPEAYKAALAREPVVRTPWYGWLIFFAAVGAIVYVGWKLMYE